MVAAAVAAAEAAVVVVEVAVVGTAMLVRVLLVEGSGGELPCDLSE